MTTVREIPPPDYQFAPCRETDPDLWHADNEETAKRICQQCPIRQACLEDALWRHEDRGVWGATNAEERARIIRQRRIPSLSRQQAAERRALAHRMHRLGDSPALISRRLHVSDATVARYLATAA